MAARVHHIFQSLGLRHLAVVDPRGYVAGIITRKDLGHAAVAGKFCCLTLPYTKHSALFMKGVM